MKTSIEAKRLSSIAVHDADRIILRTWAAARDTTVAEIVHEMIQRSQADEAKGVR